MAEAPAMPVYTDALIGDTLHLDHAEFGVYCLLLFTMWRAGGWLPLDDAKLARIARTTPGQWGRMRSTIMDFMTIDGDRFTQGRLQDELAFVRRRSRTQSENARAKSRKNKEATRAAAVPNRSQTEAPTPTPISTPIEKGTPPSPSDDLAGALDGWNTLAERLGLAKVQKLTATRAARLRARLKDVGGLEGWGLVLAIIEESDFLAGRSKTGFRATFDFLMQESSFVKLLEGNYANNRRASAAPSSAMAALRRIREDVDG